MAFNTEEQSAILVTDVDNSAAQGDHATQGFPNTQDRIFLLSYQEVYKYYPEDEEKFRSPTEYAVANGAHTYGHYGIWWLRTSYEENGSILPGYIACVPCHKDFVGFIGYYNASLHKPGICPAIWVNLNSGVLN
jgi:hypothetical protein